MEVKLQTYTPVRFSPWGIKCLGKSLPITGTALHPDKYILTFFTMTFWANVANPEQTVWEGRVPSPQVPVRQGPPAQQIN